MGYDDELIQLVKKHTQLPIIASCGPKNMADFASVFKKCDIHATLASGIFHRDEITIPALKSYLKEASIIIR
jgi:cyclase